MNYVYNNNGINFQTSWTNIKLSWLAVSTGFQTVVANSAIGGSYIWAGTLGLFAPFSGTSGALMTNSPFVFQTTEMATNAECGFINSSPGYFDVNCAGQPNARFLTHSYIMGFQFNPSGTYTLAAGALQANGGTNDLADVDEALDLNAFVTASDQTVGSTTGPRLLVPGFNGQLQYIKIAIVITTILDINTYPGGNTANFQYSGIYMGYTLVNQNSPVTQSQQQDPLNRLLGSQNYNYYPLFNAKYQIFGLSSFQIATLPSNVTVVDYQLSFPELNTVILQSNNVNYISNIRISSDRWNSQITGCSSTTNPMLNIQQKLLTTVPSLQVGQQFIIETSSALNFLYSAAPIGLAPNALSASVTFSNSLYFEKITPGMAYSLEFTFANINEGGTTPPTGYSVAGSNIQIVITVEGNQLANTLILTTIGGNTPDTTIPSPIRIGYIFKSATPVISVTITAPRDPVNALRITSNLVVTEFSNAYDPASDCCVVKCPANNGVNVFTTPPTCAACTIGLVYNSITASCQCQTGFYSVVQATAGGQSLGTTQCYPCFAPLCQSCNQTTATVCNSCVLGAAVNANNVCACLSGFYQDGALCPRCPYQCQTCSVASVCTTCADNTTRDNTTNTCACL